MLLLPLATALVSSCARDADSSHDTATAASGDSVAAPRLDSASAAAVAATESSVPDGRRPLSPLADSVAERLVFAPRTQTWFVAAARGKRLLVDFGRIDVDVKKRPDRLIAFREAAERIAPVAVGARMTVRGPWGSAPATVEGFDVWNGRIAGVLAVPETVAALVRAGDGVLVGSAQLETGDATSAPVAAPGATCSRESVPAALAARVAVLRDSIGAAITKALPAGTAPTAPVASQVAGCFGSLGRIALSVSVRAPLPVGSIERFAIVNDAGRATGVRPADLRWRAHDLLAAFDADGDGVDDLATRGVAPGAGATVLLRVDEAGKRAGRLAMGFKWGN